MRQICTNKEQSKRLLNLGMQRNTADMFWPLASSFPEACDNEDQYQVDCPAWSLGALFLLIRQYLDLHEKFCIEIKNGRIIFRSATSLCDMSNPDIFENLVKVIEILAK